MITVSANAEQWLAGLTAAQRGTGFASTVAVRRTGRGVAEDLGEATKRIFDRPTRWTQRAFYSSAREFTQSRLTRRLAITTVGVKDQYPKGTPASRYLAAQIQGGERQQKRHERAFAAAGLTSGQGFWVPGPGVRLNAYGNVPRATIRRILAALRTPGGSSGTSRPERYFVAPIGGRLHPGIWRESGKRRKLTPMFFLVTTVGYRRRFDFFGLGRQFTLQRFPRELALAMEQGFNLPRSGSR